MADVKWIKVSTDMFNSSRKIKQIEMMPEGDTILVIWLKLLLLAGLINDGGSIYITPEIPYTDEMLANELRRPLATVKIALTIFERFGMIKIEDDIMRLSSWEKYQNIDGLDKIREQNRLRKQRQREKEKQLPSGENDMSRDGHGTITQCHATEKEEEKDKEKEYHSFNQSAFSGDDFQENVDNSVDKERAKRQFLGGSLGKGVVLLSQEQMDNLLDVLSAEEFDHYVSVIAEKELQGHKYKRKTHYQAIMEMAKQDRKI